jgi:glutamate carboxypeptidase
VVAESTVVAGDLRTLDPAQLERAMATMRRIAGAHRPLTTAALEFDDGYPPLAPSEGNRRLLAIYDGASRDLGAGAVAAVDPSRAGAADVSFCEGLVAMAMDGVGLMGRGGHTVEETADLRTLPSQAQRMAVTLARLARGWRATRATPAGR